jgi:hypothetical protein
MPIEEKSIYYEKELGVLVRQDYKAFFGDVTYVTENFLINTKRNKGGKPDGFVFGLDNSI